MFPLLCQRCHLTRVFVALCCSEGETDRKKIFSGIIDDEPQKELACMLEKAILDLFGSAFLAELKSLKNISGTAAAAADGYTEASFVQSFFAN